MKRYISLIALFCCLLTAEAQLKSYITVEAGPQWSLIKVADPGEYFEGANVKSSMVGITFGQELMPNLSLVTGLYYQRYMDGINLVDDRPNQSRWAAYTALLIPLRVEYRVQVSEFPVSFTPRLGYVLGRINQPDGYFNPSGFVSAPDGTVLDYDLDHTAEEVGLHMLEVGVGLNLRFHGIWQASLNLSYMTGFTDPLSATLDYQGQGGINHTATYSTKGNTLYTSLAFSMPVSNIWQLRDYRIRKRVEGSVYDGKPTDRKGQFYAGAELGSLWRQFNVSHPAVGARPLEDRGLFRYANLHAGGYAGYMFTEDLGVDLGVYYQRSSTFYALMYDHEVDYVTETPAPMFLEIPVRIRYFYNVYKKKIYYVVYGGASLLTSFAGEGYNTGSGDFTYNTPPSGTSVNATTSYVASRVGRVRPAMRIGTGVEYSLPTKLLLIATLYVNYMHGFMATDQILVTNGVPETPNTHSVIYQGSGWSLDVGIKIPFRFDKGLCGIWPEREE